MINSTGTNVKLKFEQIQQLAEVEGRLSILQNEIDISNKILKGLKKENERAVKERDYQKELEKDLNEKIGLAQNKLKDLNNQITEKEENLKINDIQIQTIRTTQRIKDEELTVREKNLVEIEQTLKKQLDDFNYRFTQLEKDQFAIKMAKEAFLKAIDTIIWK